MKLSILALCRRRPLINSIRRNYATPQFQCSILGPTSYLTIRPNYLGHCTQGFSKGVVDKEDWASWHEVGRDGGCHLALHAPRRLLGEPLI